MQLYLNLFIFTDALHVLGGSSTYYQEHITVPTASGIINLHILLYHIAAFDLYSLLFYVSVLLCFFCLFGIYKFDIHMSVHCNIKITANKMQLFLNLSIFTGAVHVSGGSSAHHQEHITVHTSSGIVN